MYVGDLTRRTFIGAASAASVATVAACSEPVSSTPSVQPSASPVVVPATVGKPTKKWFISGGRRAPAQLIEAYTPDTSVLPGTPVPIHVSTSAPEWTIQVFRIGDYEGLGGTRLQTLGPFPGQKYTGKTSVDSQTKSVRADWPSAVSVDTTGWEPGFYLLHAVADGKRTEIPVVVRTADVTDRVAVIASVTTWQAYNLWGGRSLYQSAAGGFEDRSYAVSTNRPFDRTGRGLIYAFEVPAVRVAEESGVPLAYLTNVDLSLAPEQLNGAAGAVSTGHDEYWSVPYRNSLAKLRDEGGNLAFLGANTGYWRVRVADSGPDAGQLITCYKSAALDPVKNSRRTTARWRDAPKAQPENTVVGQLYDAFPANGALEIRDPGFFLFDGTDVSAGDTFPGLLGPETDRYYDLSTTPHPLQIPALSELIGKGNKTWSTMTYYTNDAGAGVVSTGTMGWCRSLPRPRKIDGIPAKTTAFAKQVTLNIFQQAAAGPMGTAHPAVDDSADVNLPKTNTTGAA